MATASEVPQIPLTTMADDIFTASMQHNATTPPPVATKPDNLLIKTIYFYSMGVVIPVGLFCNTLALVVFIRSPSLRRTVTGHFLMTLAIADSIFLLGDFIRWLNPTMKNFDMGLSFMNTSDAVCKITTFLRYFGKFASAWITVAITAQRFLTVVKALEVARISTVFRVRIIIGVILVISILLNVFPFWTTGILVWNGKSICAYIHTQNYDIWNTISNRIGSLALPAIIIIVLTAIIVYDLVQAGRRRRLSLNVPRKSSSSKLVIERHLSAMLVSVALAFLCLRLPYTVAYYLNDYKKKLFDPDPVKYHDLYCAAKITDVLATMNYAVNFFLYCLCGSTFRRHLIALFKGKKTSDLINRRKNVTVTTSLKTSNSINQTSIKFQPLRGSSENTANNNRDQFS